MNSIRQAAKYIYNKETGKYMDLATGEIFEAPQADKKLTSQTVLRKLFVVISKNTQTEKVDIQEFTTYHQDVVMLLKWHLFNWCNFGCDMQFQFSILGKIIPEVKFSLKMVNR